MLQFALSGLILFIVLLLLNLILIFFYYLKPNVICYDLLSFLYICYSQNGLGKAMIVKKFPIFFETTVVCFYMKTSSGICDLV